MSTPLDRHIELIIKYPETSREELKWIYANIHRLKTLDDEVAAARAQTKKHRNATTKYEKKIAALELAYDQELLRARSKATSELVDAEYIKNTSIRCPAAPMRDGNNPEDHSRVAGDERHG